jgi:4-methyl-5(b-hydroxyethyl)-thiazole monophosphate biosynthesis
MSQSGLKLQVRKLFTEIKFEDFDFLVIPGGKAVSLTHLESKDTQSAIKYFQENNKLICAICAAPAVLGKYGLLDGKKFTCFPSFEKYAPKGKYLPKKTVVQDGNIITSKAAGTTFDFAYKIVSYLLGKDAAKRLAKEIYS